MSQLRLSTGLAVSTTLTMLDQRPNFSLAVLRMGLKRQFVDAGNIEYSRPLAEQRKACHIQIYEPSDAVSRHMRMTEPIAVKWAYARDDPPMEDAWKQRLYTAAGSAGFCYTPEMLTRQLKPGVMDVVGCLERREQELVAVWVYLCFLCYQAYHAIQRES
ncbi:hypothetical protein F4777DRAFT_579918 [Nemania sp. FL0916]|nr:hypothetical protein F4777DRAFT_579918 [Nemania sp. FL0916]